MNETGFDCSFMSTGHVMASDVNVRLRSDLVPEHGARERFLMGTNVNTPKLQAPTPEFGHGARARVQGLDLVLRHYMVLGALKFPLSEHNTIFFQCSGTSARAPNVNRAYVCNLVLSLLRVSDTGPCYSSSNVNETFIRRRYTSLIRVPAAVLKCLS